MWTSRIFTLYPELFPGPFNYGLYKKALEKNIWSLKVCNIRDGATDKHKTVDDTPFWRRQRNDYETRGFGKFTKQICKTR